jgi:DNA-binding winged helix-turn-helix (wHTH) protein
MLPAQNPRSFLQDLSSVSLYAALPMSVPNSVQTFSEFSDPLCPLTADTVFQFGAFKLNETQRLLSYQNHPIEIQPRTFDVLLVLLKNRSRLVTKQELLAAVWPDSFVDESNLGVHVARLRKTLRRHSVNEEYIQTVHKHGYRFIAHVSLVLNRIQRSRNIYPARVEVSLEKTCTDMEAVATTIPTRDGVLRIEGWKCSEGSQIKLAVPTGLGSLQSSEAPSFVSVGLQISPVDRGGAMLDITVSLDFRRPGST